MVYRALLLSSQGRRRLATRYDKLARNYFSALCFVAMLAYWL
jgi:hypothetical protein